MDSYEDFEFRNFNVFMCGGKNSMDVEKALIAIVIKALNLKSFNQRRITLGIYEGYLNRLQRSVVPEVYVNDLAKKIIPDNDAYTAKRADAYKWYREDLADELDKLFVILLNISNMIDDLHKNNTVVETTHKVNDKEKSVFSCEKCGGIFRFRDIYNQHMARRHRTQLTQT